MDDNKETKNTEIKTINGYFVKQNIACRLSNDMVELIDENFDLITGGTTNVTDRRLVECLLDLALSKVRPGTEDKKRIQDLIKAVDKLTLENEELKQQKDTVANQLSFAKNSLESLNADQSDSEVKIENLRGELSSLEHEIGEVKNINESLVSIIERYKNNASPVPDGAILVELSESETKVLDMVCNSESERMKKDITPGMLLKNVFFFILVKGPHDVFSAPISLQKIRQLSEPTQK